MPIQLALFHFVQLLFHACGEGDIHDIREILLHHIGNHDAQLGWEELLLFAHDIAARQNGGNRRRIGGRAAEPFSSSARTSEASV